METDREKQGLKGAVKSVLAETSRFEEQGGQVTEQPLFSQTMNFNEAGWLTEQTDRSPDGWEGRTVSDYSDSQKLLTTRRYEASGALFEEVRYLYDDQERLVAEQHITRDGKVTTPITYVYNISGGKTQIKELDYTGDATLMLGIEGTMSTINATDATRIETRYDDRDNVVEIKIFNSAGSLVGRVEILRDASGNIIEETQYHGDVVRFGPGSATPEQIEALSEEEKAEFAAAVEQFFSPGTAMSKQTHEYDADGRLIESKLMMIGMMISRQTFSYDESGNKAEEITYSEYEPVGGKSIFTRDYDEHGNWTKELVSTVSNWDAEFGLSKPVHLTRRTITYYT